MTKTEKHKVKYVPVLRYLKSCANSSMKKLSKSRFERHLTHSAVVRFTEAQ